jgi:hypothetical protein
MRGGRGGSVEDEIQVFRLGEEGEDGEDEIQSFKSMEMCLTIVM